MAICASGLPLLFLLPHIHAIHVYSQSYWSLISFGTLSDIYFTLFYKLIVLAMLGCAAFGFWASLDRKQLRGSTAEFGTLPLHELAAAGGYLLLPLACFALSFYTKALHYRYVIATVIGVSLFVPFILWTFRSIFSAAAGVLCALLVLNLLYTTLLRVRSADEDTWGTFASCSELFNPATKEIYQSTQALVVSDGPFLVIAKYGNANLRGKSFYLLNRVRRTNAETVFRGLRSAVQGPFNLAELSEFERAHRSFLMYKPDLWLLDQLVAEGNRVAILANWPHGFLYEVTVRQ
jgi:hypothetical protein